MGIRHCLNQQVQTFSDDEVQYIQSKGGAMNLMLRSGPCRGIGHGMNNWHSYCQAPETNDMEGLAGAMLGLQLATMAAQQPEPTAQSSLVPGVLGFIAGAAVVTSGFTIRKRLSPTSFFEPLIGAK